MIELNYNFKVGDIIEIPEGLSWQVDEFLRENDIYGKYRIIECPTPRFDGGVTPYEDCMVEFVSNREIKLYIYSRDVARLLGKYIEPIEYRLYESNYYSIEDSDLEKWLFIDRCSRDKYEEPFVYCGWCGDFRIISSQENNTEFRCYKDI